MTERENGATQSQGGAAKLPLAGVRIIDFTQVLAGPYCTQQLALLGADVVKVENRAGGDQGRGLGPATDPRLLDHAMSTLFLSVNAGKRSLTLDLKHLRAGDVVRRLAASADVLVQNFKAGTMDRMGLGYEALKQVNPRLVYCSISGYGQTGPRAPAAAYDPSIQAASGMMAVTGAAGADPLKTGYWLTDMATATQACFAVSTALYHRERTGEGDHLDLSMLDTAIGIMAPTINFWQVNGQEPLPNGNRSQTNNPTSDAFPTGDGFLMVAAPTQGQFAAFARTLGLADLPDDPRFATLADRIENADALRRKFVAALAAADAGTWEARLAEAGVPASRVASVPQVCADGQVAHRGTFRPVARQEALGGGEGTYVDLAFHGANTGRGTDRPPPLIGEHTDEVLAEFGFPEEEIAGLRREGAI